MLPNDGPRVAPLPEFSWPDYRSQTRNIAIYVAINWLFYLAAPVLYVGVVQAALCNGLGASDAIANLPLSAFFWTSAVPMIVIWRFHSVGAIKPALAICCVICALAGGLVVAAIALPVPPNMRIASVILYGALLGGSMSTITVFLWDMLNRGVDASRRGIAFSLAFGVGPIFAVLGSLAAQLTLAGRIEIPWPSQSTVIAFREFTIRAFDFPLNFAVVFAASVPIMLCAAFVATLFVLPKSQHEPVRQALLPKMVGGFREIADDPILLTAVLAFLAVSCGGTIISNMTLFTSEAVERPPEDLVGMQDAIRFSFKFVGGLLLGWLLTKTNAKMGMLACGGFCLLGIVWALFVRQHWFLFAFALMGAGELYGVYYPNYIVARSRPEQVRLTMAFIGLLSLLVSLAPPLFGAISDRHGMPASFIAAGCLVATSLALISFLPARAQPSSLQDNHELIEKTTCQPIQ